MIVAYIDAHKVRFGVELGRSVSDGVCRVLSAAGTQVAPSWGHLPLAGDYYAARTRLPSARSVIDAERTALITEVHEQNYGVYGSRKVHAELVRRGHRIARCSVERLMRAAGLRGVSRAKGPRTTVAGEGADTRPDLVQRDFPPQAGGAPTATAPDQLWVADITLLTALQDPLGVGVRRLRR